MSLISREEAKRALTGWDTDPTDEEIEYTLDRLPSVEFVEVVQCIECQSWNKRGDTSLKGNVPWGFCPYFPSSYADDFCSRGIKKTTMGGKSS